MTTFHTPFVQFRERNGTEYELLGWITAPAEGFDDEVLPMARIRFLADGAEIPAWPEEVEEAAP